MSLFGSGGKRSDAGLPEESESPGSRDGEDREREDQPLAVADDLRVKEIDVWIAAQDAIDSGGLRAAQDGAQVSRLLDCFDDEEESESEIEIDDDASDEELESEEEFEEDD